MQSFLTTGGQAVVAASQYSRIQTFKLGTQFNYIPNVTDAGIRGTETYAGNITEITVVNSSVIRLTIILPATVGPFNYGEIGIYLDNGNLFSLSAFEASQVKNPLPTDPDSEAFKLDLYINVAGGTATLSAGTSRNKILSLNSHIELPIPISSSNAYIIPDGSGSMLVFAHGNTWDFTGFVRTPPYVTSVANSTSGFTTPGAVADFSPGRFVQITQGENIGQVRKIAVSSQAGANVVVSYDAPLLKPTSAADEVTVHARTSSSSSAGLTNPLSSLMDAANNRIVNLGSPTAPTDASTKGYVDTSLLSRLPIAGGTMTGSIAMGNNVITGLPTPVAGSSAANKDYVDTTSATAASAPFTSDRSAGNNKLTNVATPTAVGDATTKGYVDTATAARSMGGFPLNNLAAPTAATDASTKGYVDSTVSTATAARSMGGFQINNLATPTVATDAATKGYTDSNFLKLDGTSNPTANLSMATFKLTNVGAPTGGTDVTNKTYVDNLSLGARGTLAAGVVTGTISATDFTIIAAPGSTQTLPNPATVTGKHYIVKNAGTTAVTVSTVSGTIDGNATAVINEPYGCLEFVSDGAHWAVLTGVGTILRSPDNTRWYLSISNSGNLTVISF